MKQAGEHTWPLYIRYHQCPKCGKIIESREDYQYVMGRYQKELQCSRCNHSFTLIEKHNPSFGPLIGDPQPPTFEWQ